MSEWEPKTSYIPRKGDIVKVTFGVGVIVDVYTSESTGKTVLEIHYPKNVVRLQRPEFSPLELMQELGIAPATQDDLLADMDRVINYQAEQHQLKVDEILELAGIKKEAKNG